MKNDVWVSDGAVISIIDGPLDINVYAITMSVECEKCGRTWGIRCQLDHKNDDLYQIKIIGGRRAFICNECQV